MDIVYFIIVTFLVISWSRAIEATFLERLLVASGFVVGIVIGSWLAKSIAAHIGSPLIKLALMLGVEVLFALVFSKLGGLIGFGLTSLGGKPRKIPTNKSIGIASWITSATFLLIFLAGAIPAHDQKPSTLLVDIQRIISPNGQPNLLLSVQAPRTSVARSRLTYTDLVRRAVESTVKIQGVGCGGLLSGSGFVLDSGHVITNAHVIAGVSDLQVVDRFNTSPATLTFFDPQHDIAVLKVKNLGETALNLSSANSMSGERAYIMGYADGGPLSVGEATIINEQNLAFDDIYGNMLYMRDVYTFRGNVEHGQSGGPLVDTKGNVLGMLFAKSTDTEGEGLALTARQIKDAINSHSNHITNRQCALD